MTEEKNAGKSEDAGAIAEGLWQRFRLLAMVIDKADRFVGMSANGTPREAQRGEANERWLDSLAENREETESIAEDLVLRAFQVGLEPTNFIILKRLRRGLSMSFSDLMRETRLNRLSLSERVNDLIQVGLATKEIGTNAVVGTTAAQGLVDFVEKTRQGLADRILERLCDLEKGGAASAGK